MCDDCILKSTRAWLLKLSVLYIHSFIQVHNTTFQIKTVFNNVLFSTEVHNHLHAHLLALSHLPEKSIVGILTITYEKRIGVDTCTVMYENNIGVGTPTITEEKKVWVHWQLHLYRYRCGHSHNYIWKTCRRGHTCKYIWEKHNRGNTHSYMGMHIYSNTCNAWMPTRYSVWVSRWFTITEKVFLQ